MLIRDTKILMIIDSQIHHLFDEQIEEYKKLVTEYETKIHDNTSNLEEIFLIKENIREMEIHIIYKAVAEYSDDNYIDNYTDFTFNDLPTSYSIPFRVTKLLSDTKKGVIKGMPNFTLSQKFDLKYFDPTKTYEEDITNPLYGDYLISLARRKMNDPNELENNPEIADYNYKYYLDNFGIRKNISYYLRENVFQKYERLSYWLAKTVLTDQNNSDKINTIRMQMKSIEDLVKRGLIKDESYYDSSTKISKKEAFNKFKKRKIRAYTRAALGLYSEELLQIYEEDIAKEDNESFINSEYYKFKMSHPYVFK